LTFAIRVSDCGVGRGLLFRDIADDTEALRDQFNDSLVEVAE
jgi:hypothetical protein